MKFPARQLRPPWIPVFCILSASLMAAQAWNGRYVMNADGISYIDLADRLLHGDFHALANPVWSPLYPCLLALTFKLISPPAALEFPVVHLVNWLIGLGALASFTFFLRYWQPDPPGEAGRPTFPVRAALAYSLFIYSTVDLVGLDLVTPDLCVEALVFLTVGLFLRSTDTSRPFRTFVLLGIVLGVSYFAKAGMMLLNLLFLVLLFLIRAKTSRGWGLAVAGLVFLILAAPLVVVLSRQQGHLSSGEVGRLAYMGSVQRPAGVAPEPRLVARVPVTLDFRNTTPGTYPPQYDLVYFFGRLRGEFDLARQLDALLKSAKALFGIPGNYALLTGVLVLSYFAWRQRVSLDWSGYVVTLWPLATFAVYSLVMMNTRYLGAFWPLFWLGIYRVVSPAGLKLGQRATYALVGCCLGLPVICSTLLPPCRPAVEFMESRELARLGVHPGDDIAIVGSYPRASFAARQAGLRIIAQVPDDFTRNRFRLPERFPPSDLFWILPAEQITSLETVLRQAGAKAILSLGGQCTIAGARWHSLGQPGDCVELLK
jgi:hypothetical protein